MSHTIKAGGMLSAHFLEVTFFGVRYQDEDSRGYGARRFRFEEIDCVMLAADHTLSFQVKDEIFKIPTSATDGTHRTAIAALVEGVRRSAGETTPPIA